MIGDIKLFKKEHFKKSDYILPHIIKFYNLAKRNKNRRVVVLICGESGIGKTEVASILQQKLWDDYGLRVKIVHIDDYYKTSWEERDKIRKKRGIKSVGLKEINWSLFKKLLRDYFAHKREIKVQRIHKYTNSIEEVICKNPAIDILIIEGLYSLYIKDIYPSDSILGIFLEGNYRDTYKFRKERAKENPDDNFRKRVIKKEHEVVQKLKSKADIVVPLEVKAKKNKRG